MCTNPIEMLVKREVAPNEFFCSIEKVPCGKCLDCLNQKSIEWSYRIMDEVHCHAENCFITLTYENSPIELIRKDLTDFIKRLRKKLEPIKIRYFACGEYGSKYLRPHFHLIIFGWCPHDLIKWKKDGDYWLYRSAFLESVWTLGFSSVGQVTLYSAKYCAKYLQKFKKVPAYLTQPFITMSNRPGIGFYAINSNSLVTDKIYRDGHYVKIPRYYLKKFEESGFDLSELKARRQLKAILGDSPKATENRRAREKILLDNLVKK